MTDNDLRELEARVAEALDVPEPSPLFWEHFPNRVRTALAAAPPAPAAWWRRRVFVFALSVGLVAGASSWAAWTALRADPGRADQNRMVREAPTAGAAGDVALADDSSGDAGWDVVSSVAASAGIETVREAGFGVSPGGADAAIEGLTDEERAELMALLRAEMSGDEGGL